MTDEEILAMIEQSPSELWTLEQIEAVREQITASPTLRKAMAERLRFDEVLSVAFDAESLRPEKVVAAAAQLRPMKNQNARRRWPWGVAIALTIALFASAWIWWPMDIPFVSGTNPRGDGSSPNGRNPVERDRPDSVGRKARDDAGDSRRKPPPRAPEPDEAPAAAPGDIPVAVKIDKPVPAARLEPWQTARHLGGAARSFDTVAFVDVGDGPFTPRRDDLRRWLLGLPGLRLDVQERDIDGRRCATFDGTARFAPPWPDDAMLRMALRDANKLRIYFWRGSRGVMLHYHEDRRFAWAAYLVQRDAVSTNGSPKPTSYALAATDDERGFRTSRDGRGAFDVYWKDNSLILARGGIQLLAAALDGPPEEVIFDGRACFLGLSMARANDLPPASVLPPPTLVEQKPAHRKWEAKTPAGSTFAQSDDGDIELSAVKTKASAQAFTAALPKPDANAIYEVTCRIDAATPGASVFVADDEGEYAEVLRFMHDRAHGGQGVWIVNANDGRQDAHENLDNGPSPLVGEQAWIRILCGGGVMRAWLSADGVHWASPWPIRTGVVPRRFGVSLWPGESPRRIRVGELAWRELTGLATLAPADLIAKAEPQASEGKFYDWRQRVLSQQPPESDEDAWQRAAALAALSAGATGQLGRDLVTYLAAETARIDLPFEARRRALDELCLLTNTWDDPRRAREMMDVYTSLGAPAGGEESLRPYTTLAVAMAQSPLVSREGVAPDTQWLARLEVLRLVDAQRWDDLDQLCRVLRFRDNERRRDRPRDPRRDGSLVDWAQSLARRHVPGVEGEPRPATHPLWRDVLVEQFNTDAFNVLAEFQSAVEGQAYRDAAETIATAGGKLVESTDTLGVLPDDKNQGLYVSLRVAVEQAMRDHPGLESAMQERFGPTARLRVQRAIADGNLSAIEAATLQYHGTAAAAEAHLWLGNRALSAGEFARAARHFGESAQSNDESIATEAGHRLRLSAALAGRNAGEPVSTSVRIGERNVAAGDFERVVARMIERSTDARAPSTVAGHDDVRRRVAPAEFTTEKRGTFRLGPFDQPRAIENEEHLPFAVDWFARCMSMSAVDNTVIINGRTSAVAYDAQNGVRLWAAALRGSPADAKDWVSCSSRPLVLGQHVFLRWFAKNGPVLVCLGLQDGRIVWQSQMGDGHLVVGDPFSAQEELFALVARPDALQQHWQLSLVGFDAASGEAVRSRPLVRLNEAWRELSVCQATVSRDRLFVSLGGVVLCADLSGQVHWVRTLPHVPTSVDRWSYVQMHDPPIVVADRVFVATPTVRKVVCLEAASGRVVWQRGEVNLVQLVGLWSDRLVIRNSEGLVGLNTGDGTPQWRFDVEGQCEVLLGPGMSGGESQGTLLVAEEVDQTPKRGKEGSPTLTWIDPSSGEATGTWANVDWNKRGGQFGSAGVGSQGRIWGLRGENWRGDTREVVELFPPGVAVPSATAAEPSPPPATSAASSELQKAADKTLAGWTVVSGATDSAAALVKHLESDDTVRAVADKSHAVVFSRNVTLRAQSNGRLRIKAGYVANEDWTILVTAGERTLLEATIGGNAEPGWERFELELAPIAGQATTFTVTATSPDGRPRKTLWKRLEVNP